MVGKIPKYQNDIGVASISIPSKVFMCAGASKPMDHPHVYLNIGDSGETVCPYCSTKYSYDSSIKDGMTSPENCDFTNEK